MSFALQLFLLPFELQIECMDGLSGLHGHYIPQIRCIECHAYSACQYQEQKIYLGELSQLVVALYGGYFQYIWKIVLMNYGHVVMKNGVLMKNFSCDEKMNGFSQIFRSDVMKSDASDVMKSDASKMISLCAHLRHEDKFVHCDFLQIHEAVSL